MVTTMHLVVKEPYHHDAHHRGEGQPQVLRKGLGSRLAAELAIDVSSAVGAALTIAPIVSIADRAIVSNASGKMVRFVHCSNLTCSLTIRHLCL
jgi:hypothetical protein